MKRGDRVTQGTTAATVVDVHADGVHISVLPDVGPRALVRWRAEEVTT